VGHPADFVARGEHRESFGEIGLALGHLLQCGVQYADPLREAYDEQDPEGPDDDREHPQGDEQGD